MRSGRRLPVTADLADEPHQGVEVVGHPLLERDDAVVGDVDVFRTDLRTALGNVASLEMHPLDTLDRLPLVRNDLNIGLCNITKCCTEVCPEDIHITDNAIIPLKERVAGAFYDPIAWVLRFVRGKKAGARQAD